MWMGLLTSGGQALLAGIVMTLGGLLAEKGLQAMSGDDLQTKLLEMQAGEEKKSRAAKRALAAEDEATARQKEMMGMGMGTSQSRFALQKMLADTKLNVGMQNAQSLGQAAAATTLMPNAPIRLSEIMGLSL